MESGQEQGSTTISIQCETNCAIQHYAIQTLISQGIVEKSQLPHYSQILMVPTPDGTFRMCVDYRALNDCTADASWPIPNIAEMLRRIGSQKPKIFGIMDLTQGYHQAPLTFATRAYTAFITFISSHDCRLDQSRLHLISKKSWPL